MKTLSKEYEIILLPTGQKGMILNTTMNYTVKIYDGTILYVDVNLN